MNRPMRNVMVLSVLALLGCGGGGSASTDTTTTTTTTTGGEAEHVAWDDMTHEQRGQYMAEVVMPAMQPLFQNHDATRYAEFSCGTCHGANAHEVNFVMPNGVHPLTHADITATFQSQDPSATWMTQQVWPEMARLIGEPPFDPATGQGFSCMNCHANGEPAAAH